MTLVESFSGIRGIYGESLTDELAQKYAQAFLRWLKRDESTPTLVVGRDTRESSPALAKVFAAAWSAAGCAVLDVGVSSIPATENAVRYFGAHGGVMITGSHNPAEWNGWKLLRSDGAILSARDAGQIINYVQQNDFSRPAPAAGGEVIDKSEVSLAAYVELLMRIVGREWIRKIKARHFKILFDAVGGAVIPLLRPVVARFGIEPIWQNIEPGVFNRPIEPTVDSLKYLAPLARDNQVEFAVGFDADADRAEIVLPSGELVSGQYLVALLVDEVLATTANAEKQIVVLNDASSDLIHEIANQHGARIQEVEVGEINVVDKMKELDSAVGGEGSNGGGIIGHTTCRDGLLTALLILRTLARTGRPLSGILANYPKFYTLNKKLSLPGKIYNRDEIEKLFASEPGVVISKTGDVTGGIKIRYPDQAWLWFRGSKTEAGVVRVYAEAKSEARAQALLDQGCNLLNT